MKRNAGFAILAVLFVVVVWPSPATERLYAGNGGGLRGKASDILGALVPFPMDPTFYYRFEISPADLDHAVGVPTLRRSPKSELELALAGMQDNGPMFWHLWWWRPRVTEEAELYVGCDESGCLSLLYDRARGQAFVVIQNT